MKELLGCMDMQCAALAEFTLTLDLEAQSLQQGHFKDLPSLIARKTELARQLAELDYERERLLALAGLPIDLPTALAEPALERAWGRLREQAAQARQANHRNGVMVHTLLDFTRQAMATLHGGNRPLYGSNGRHPAAGVHPGKSLARG